MVHSSVVDRPFAFDPVLYIHNSRVPRQTGLFVSYVLAEFDGKKIMHVLFFPIASCKCALLNAALNLICFYCTDALSRRRQGKPKALFLFGIRFHGHPRCTNFLELSFSSFTRCHRRKARGSVIVSVAFVVYTRT